MRGATSPPWRPPPGAAATSKGVSQLVASRAAAWAFLKGDQAGGEVHQREVVLRLLGPADEQSAVAVHPRVAGLDEGTVAVGTAIAGRPPARAGAQGVVDVLVEVERREHQDPRRRLPVAVDYSPRGLDPVEGHST
jgi:hypothetical protein